MARIKGAMMTRKRRNKTLKLAKGYFGELTESAVKQFQRQNSLTVDGTIGIQTMTKLLSSNARKKPVEVPQVTQSSGGSSSSSGSLYPFSQLLHVPLIKENTSSTAALGIPFASRRVFSFAPNDIVVISSLGSLALSLICILQAKLKINLKYK